MIATPAHRDVFTVVDDLRLHHVDHGGEGTPVVLLHGVTGHATAWTAVAPSLTTAGRVLALDLRGCGDSQWSPSADYGTTRHARDVIGVLDALGHDRVTVIGSSWGALIALAVAELAPDRVDRLALVDIEPSFELGETDVFPRPRSFAHHADAVAHERSANPHATDALLDVVAAGATRPGPDGTLVPKHDPYFFEHWPFRSDDWWGAIERLTIPTLVVHAGDSFVRREVTERMAGLLTQGRHVEIPDSTHVIPIDAPEALVDALLAFLR
jgi:pimeloyl-ACP methyl ester carboxylesterase